MQAAPPQSPTAEVQMMGGDITGSCLDNDLGDPDDHMLARQQAGLDDETLQLVQKLAARPNRNTTSEIGITLLVSGPMTSHQVMTSQLLKCDMCSANQTAQSCCAA